MAGQYSTTAKYETDDGTVYNIRVQPETVAANIGAANAAPAGAVTGKGTVRVNAGNREFGIKARSVSLIWTAAAPDGYEPGSPVRIPILTKSVFDGIVKGTTGTYLGAACKVVGKSPERIN